MKLVSLQVQHFGCIKRASLELAPGLNVVYGANDSGKSTLVQAIRAALLLPHSSSAFKAFVPWQEQDAVPQVQLTFEVVENGLPRFYRVSKHFGQRAQLDLSNDGKTFQQDKAAREVDEKLRALLQWGVPAVGSGRGMPDSFLLKVLMASQPEVTGILNAALSDDGDANGKQHILGAMAALAEEPLFKQVLARAQRHVSEAFSATGRRRTGKGSPWVELRDKLNKATEEVTQLTTQRDQSAAVLAKLRHLDNEVLECEAELTDAKRHWQQANARWSAQLALGALQAEMQRARSDLQEQEQRMGELAVATAQEAQLLQAVEQARAAARLCEAARDVELGAVAAAEQHVLQLQQADAARDAQLLESRLRERQTKLQAELETCTRRGELAQAVRDRHATSQKQQQAAEQLQREVQERELQVQAAQVKLENAQQQLRLLQVQQRQQRHAELLGQLQHAEFAAQTSRRYQQEAAHHAEQAQQLETAQLALKLPSAAQLQQLRELQGELLAQQAALNLGLTALVAPTAPPLQLGVTADNGAARQETLFASATFSSQHTLRLELPGATLELSVGSSDSHRALEQLRARWQREGEPILQAANVSGLARLESVVKTASEQRDEAARLRRSASDREQLASGLDAQLERVEALKKQVASSALELADAPPGVSTDVALDEAKLARTLAQAEQQLRELEQVFATCREQLLTTRTQRDGAVAHATQLEAAYREAELRLGTEWQPELQRLAEMANSLRSQKLEVDAELARQVVQQGDQLLAAQNTLTLAQSALEAAQSKVHNQQAVLRDAENSLNEHRGKLMVLKQAAEASHLAEANSAAQEATDAYERALQACLVDGQLLSEPQLKAASDAVAAAETRVREKRTERDQARGGLMEVGGDVVEEELRDANHALGALRRDLDETELNYAAWQMLETALHEAERKEASNLGQLLSAPLEARFAQLTSGRYSKLDVGPDLRTAGFLAAGEVRKVETLSAGTQQQLSTLFRLCLAEALQTAVILDDHLSQTDSKKMLWFRTALDEIAQKSQVVVITCWPDPYKPAGNVLDTARRIDAASIIERY